MVRAILAGIKTQTRRIVKPQPFHANVQGSELNDEWRIYSCPYGQPGDRLWVKETHRPDVDGVLKCGVQYRADMETKWGADSGAIREWKDQWRPSIFMPRWASRITLEIESIRVERLQEISEADAKAEGVDSVRDVDIHARSDDRGVYRDLWESINGKGSWALNPWGWVVGFKVAEPAKNEGGR